MRAHALALPMMVSGTIVLAACAVPATEVAVPTMSMTAALDQARAEGTPTGTGAPDAVRLASVKMPASVPAPQMTTPEVRLAYVYEWVDAEGNKHFGEWVAIPIAGFAWVMSDGTRAPADGNSRSGNQHADPR